jgi:2-phospho-L-lactate guanylyltransferase (CobY/MobA/RfbA family)
MILIPVKNLAQAKQRLTELAAARATEKPCLVLELPGVALDVDNPSDLRQLAAARGETRTQSLVRKLDLFTDPTIKLPQAAGE